MNTPREMTGPAPRSEPGWIPIRPLKPNPRRTTMSRIITSACLLAGLLLFAPAALAQKTVTTSVTVDYSDLDISRPAGAETLMTRLESASKKICGRRPMQVRFEQLEQYLQCRSSVVEDAVRRIDQPVVTMAFENSTGRKPVRLASR
jgi:UrcA family protein